MCQVSPSSAERMLRFEMETCSGAGVQLRPWGKNDRFASPYRRLFAFQEVFGAAQRSDFQHFISTY